MKQILDQLTLEELVILLKKELSKSNNIPVLEGTK